MAYEKLGQKRTGHLSAASTNPKREKGSSPPRQTLRGYGGAASRNTVPRGSDPRPVQKTRGHRQTTAKTSIRKVGKIKKGRA